MLCFFAAGESVDGGPPAPVPTRLPPPPLRTGPLGCAAPPSIAPAAGAAYWGAASAAVVVATVTDGVGDGLLVCFCCCEAGAMEDSLESGALRRLAISTMSVGLVDCPARANLHGRAREEGLGPCHLAVRQMGTTTVAFLTTGASIRPREVVHGTATEVLFEVQVQSAQLGAELLVWKEDGMLSR